MCADDRFLFQSSRLSRAATSAGMASRAAGPMSLKVLTAVVPSSRSVLWSSGKIAGSAAAAAGPNSDTAASADPCTSGSMSLNNSARAGTASSAASGASIPRLAAAAAPNRRGGVVTTADCMRGCSRRTGSYAHDGADGRSPHTAAVFAQRRNCDVPRGCSRSADQGNSLQCLRPNVLVGMFRGLNQGGHRGPTNCRKRTVPTPLALAHPFRVRTQGAGTADTGASDRSIGVPRLQPRGLRDCRET